MPGEGGKGEAFRPRIGYATYLTIFNQPDYIYNFVG